MIQDPKLTYPIHSYTIHMMNILYSWHYTSRFQSTATFEPLPAVTRQKTTHSTRRWAGSTSLGMKKFVPTVGENEGKAIRISIYLGIF